MSITRGAFTIEESFQQTLEFDEFGIAASSMQWTGLWTLAPAFVNSVTKHPDFSWLKKKGGQVFREEAGWATIQINFEGLPPETNAKFYKLSGATNSEPIQTHPRFDEFGLTANGAIFDSETGAFGGWLPLIAGEINVFAGMENYLAPGLLYEEKWVLGRSSKEAHIFDKLGEIDKPSASQQLPTYSRRNWLFIGGDSEPVGDGAIFFRRWQLSGPRKWNSVVYNDNGL